MVNSKRLSASGFCCTAFGVCMIIVLSAGCMRSSPNQYRFVRLGLEKDYTRIRLQVDDVHGFKVGKLILTQGDSLFSLTDISQLKGHVTIKSSDQAVLFVRFRTSLATWRYWTSGDQLEIVNESLSKHLPTYGLPPHLMPFELVGSGFCGVLSNKAYKVGRFHPIKCRRICNRFEVVRWLIVEDPSFEHLEKVSETVSEDGGYERKVLVSKPLPDLPDTRWEIPHYL